MSKKFNFKNHSLSLEINGVEFEVKVINNDMSKKLIDTAYEMQQMANNPDTTEELVEEKIIGAIELVLGEGAVKKIFHDREIEFLDLFDVLFFLEDEIVAYRNDEINAKYGLASEDVKPIN